MKKGSLIFLILILITSILGMAKIHLNKKKPYNFYYTNLLAKNLTICSKCKATILNTNFYKTLELSEDDIDTTKSFLKELRKNNFTVKPPTIDDTPAYKLFFSFADNKEKYVINVYSERYISVYPWDGEFEMDFIDMTEIPIHYNIYGLSKYIFSR